MPEGGTIDEFRVDIGGADKGRTFVRVIHVGSGREKTRVGLGQLRAETVADQLKQELREELAAEERLSHA